MIVISVNSNLKILNLCNRQQYVKVTVFEDIAQRKCQNGNSAAARKAASDPGDAIYLHVAHMLIYLVSLNAFYPTSLVT